MSGTNGLAYFSFWRFGMLVCLWRYAVSRNIIPVSFAFGFLGKLLFHVQFKEAAFLVWRVLQFPPLMIWRICCICFSHEVGDCWLEVVSLSLYSTVEMSSSLVVAFSDSQFWKNFSFVCVSREARECSLHCWLSVVSGCLMADVSNSGCSNICSLQHWRINIPDSLAKACCVFRCWVCL